MKAVVWHGKGDVRVDEVPDPRIEEPTDAVVKITSTAICGSDLHLYSKLYPVMKEGDIIGHEPMGVVVETGRDVGHIAPGDRVVIPFNISCGQCFMCDRGLYSQCETTQNVETRKGASLFGYTHLYGAIPGGQAEYLRVPQAHFGPIPVPEGPPDERFLFLSDILPTAWQAVVYAEVPKGGVLAVWGLGPVGQLCVRVAALHGVESIIGLDLVPERLELARAWGAQTIDLRDAGDPVDEIRGLTGGRGADSAIDAVGMEASGSVVDSVLSTMKVQTDKMSALHGALGSVRRGGTLSITGVYGGPMLAFPLGDLFDKQVTIRMGQANVRRWTPDILPMLLDDDRLGIDEFATHHMPLDEAPHAYEMFQHKSDGAIKIVLHP